MRASTCEGHRDKRDTGNGGSRFKRVNPLTPKRGIIETDAHPKPQDPPADP